MIVKSTTADFTPKNEYYKKIAEEAFFFDIETTGLSHQFNNIISITVYLYEDFEFKIYQLFCEFRHDEKEILKFFKDLVKNKVYAVTYNGNTFDIPFMTNKAGRLNIDFNFENYIKIDLYQDLRRVKNKTGLNSLKLQDVEEYFDFGREDTFSGHDITILYEAYKAEPRKEFSELILQHNYEDVCNLPLLLEKIFDLYDEIIFRNNMIIKIINEQINFKKNMLICSLCVNTGYKRDFTYPSINFDLNLNVKSQLLSIKIPAYFYKDDSIKGFYYLNNDDFNMKSYTSIKGIKKNLIPLKINDEILYGNINKVVIKILEQLK